MSILFALIIAGLLTCFNMDEILIAGTNEILGTDFSTNVYWLIAFIISVIIALIKLILRIRARNQHKD